jgi:hypothetical protein
MKTRGCPCSIQGIKIRQKVLFGVNPGHACQVLAYTFMHATKSLACMPHTSILSCMPQDPGHACIILPYSHACHKILVMHATYFHTLMHATISWITMPYIFMQAIQLKYCMYAYWHAFHGPKFRSAMFNTCSKTYRKILVTVCFTIT